MTDPTNQPENQPPPPNQPPPGYPAPPPMPYAGQAPPPAGPRNGLGTAALILAIIGLLTFWSVIGGITLGIVAVILGFVGRGRVKRGEANNGGVALAGILLGFLSIAAALVWLAIMATFGFWAFKEGGGRDYIDCMNKAGNDTSAQQQCADKFRENLETRFSVTLTTSP
jgi:hypothetical protein